MIPPRIFFFRSIMMTASRLLPMYNMPMTELEAILAKLTSLSPNERSRLLSELLRLNGSPSEAEELAVGRRGLASWTQSTAGEPWDDVYPDELRNSRKRTA